MPAVSRLQPTPAIPSGDYTALLERAAALGLHKPDPVPPDQAWFWTPAWWEGTVEALDDLAAGRVYSQDSDDEFFAFLDEHSVPHHMTRDEEDASAAFHHEG